MDLSKEIDVEQIEKYELRKVAMVNSTIVESPPENNLFERHSSFDKLIIITAGWSLIQSIKKRFGECWSKEYLGELQTRKKWKLPQSNLKRGQLVMLYHRPTGNGCSHLTTPKKTFF
ncbi:hypothetical protein TNCT_21871 [Trichonephila clavata]|uniref:DUF5641 domain-containing protein n=1 Tax=Trichonephila clavata TaxID=2740835 RepID=A0A8X6JWD2_TRICU|nr:hypothetical protein TNCT_21871 [Trichonephila clavata]